MLTSITILLFQELKKYTAGHYREAPMQNFSIISGSGFIGSCMCRKLFNSINQLKIIDKASIEKCPKNTIEADFRSLSDISVSTKGVSVLVNLVTEN